jgi:hypothetical protein
MPVVTDQPQLTKFIHEEVDAGPGGADHVRQGFLADVRTPTFSFIDPFGYKGLSWAVEA